MSFQSQFGIKNSLQRAHAQCIPKASAAEECKVSWEN